MPLYVRILFAVALGALTAKLCGPRAIPLGDAGMLVIRMLKALATPLVLFAVVDAFLRTHIPARKGARLLALSALNACVAIAIGLGVANLLQWGKLWRGQIGALTQTVASGRGAGAHAPSAPHASLNPFTNLAGYVPESVLEPFARNNIITVVLLAVVFGAALRAIKERNDPEHARAVAAAEDLARVGFLACARVLEWVVALVPFAVFGIVASVVARTGFGVFAVLAPFLATVLIGLFIHAVVYYALLVRTLGGRSPRDFFAGALDAIVTALSCGSSLATLPITLRCLNDKLHVSPDSARLAACVGTNLNHDGIILYEAAAAIFVAQAFGFELSVGQQVAVALASVMAGVGIAGVPEAGLITLPLVLSAAGIPDAAAAAVIPLLLPVDWVIGRARATTNVLSDMAVAVILDRGAVAATLPVTPGGGSAT